MKQQIRLGLLLIALCVVQQSHAQFIELTCEEKAEILLQYKNDFENYPLAYINSMIDYITPCSELTMMNPKSHFVRGLLHLQKGDKFFQFGQRRERSYFHTNFAADLGHAEAAYTHAMNILTKNYPGTFPSARVMLQNFNKALAKNYKPDIVHYALGYTKLKNLVSNDRVDYTPANLVNEAKQHFEQSNHPMAKHWLAIMHYYGYATPVDRSKAYQMLSENNIFNSNTLLPKLQAQTNDWIPISAEERLASLDNFKSLDAAQTIIKQNVDDVTRFSGHFLEYDWTANGVRRYLPITLELQVMSEQSRSKQVRYELTINGTTHTGLAELRDRFGQVSLTFNSKPITITGFNRFLQDHPDKPQLTYQIKSLTLKETIINTQPVLIAKINFGFESALVLEFNEDIRQPLRMILYPEAATASQTELLKSSPIVVDQNFAVVSPNPIGNRFYITYTLDQPAGVQVAVYDFFGRKRIQVPTQKNKNGGEQRITVDSSSLPSGTYVIQMIINGQPYSKTVIKE